jgi:hypothetical protein
MSKECIHFFGPLCIFDVFVPNLDTINQPWNYQPSHNNTKDKRLHRNNDLTLFLFSLLLRNLRLCSQGEINLDMYVKCPKCLSDFNQSLTFSKMFIRGPNKIYWRVSGLIHAEGRTDGHESNRCFFATYTNAPNNSFLLYLASTLNLRLTEEEITWSWRRR